MLTLYIHISKNICYMRQLSDLITTIMSKILSGVINCLIE